MNPAQSQQQHSSPFPQPQTHHQEETQQGKQEEGRDSEKIRQREGREGMEARVQFCVNCKHLLHYLFFLTYEN